MHVVITLSIMSLLFRISSSLHPGYRFRDNLRFCSNTWRVRSFTRCFASKNSAKEERILVIVESPAKARTIQKIVGENSDKFIVDSCAGHIRDLANVKDFPSTFQPSVVYAPLNIRNTDLGVDVFDDFKPFYVPMKGKTDIIRRLKEKSKQVDRILLATDEDREGESISAHLVEILKPKVPYQRAVFHEITKSAIEKSFQEPREIDHNLVNAQETRRILDKLTGFTLSPVLWKYVSKGLSAGRVQSCGLYLIAKREQQRWDFKESKYYSISAAFETSSSSSSPISFEAKLIQWQGCRVAGEKDFDGASGGVKTTRQQDKLIVLDETAADAALNWLASSSVLPPTTFTISDRSVRVSSRSAPPPFITSTLQQVAARKLGMSPSRTMMLAQGLYEAGHISYMRTDSPVLSQEAQSAITTMVTDMYGAEYLQSSQDTGTSSDSGKGKKTAKQAASTPKNAQEAHEAIRPAQIQGRFRLTQEIDFDSDDARALYDLILRRTLASAMRPSKTESISVSISATKGKQSGTESGTDTAVLRASESCVIDPGFLLCMDGKRFEGIAASAAASPHAPPVNGFASLKVGQRVSLSVEHFANVKKAKDTSVAMMTVSEDGGDEEEEDDESLSENDNDTVSQEENHELSTWTRTFPALRCAAHTTRAPSRFTEASFIKELEELGVGRPSTYSTILSILKDRGYILVDKQTIVPTGVGLIVSQFLAKHFPEIVDENFTADLEKTLDNIAKGEEDKNHFLKRFFLGAFNAGGSPPSSSTTTSSQGKSQLGLLEKVDQTIKQQAGGDFYQTRSLRVPYLAQLGEISVYNRNLFFNYHAAAETTSKQATAASAVLHKDADVSVQELIGEDGMPNLPDDIFAPESPSPSLTASSSATDHHKQVIRKKLPPELENDLRLWTLDTIAALKGDDGFIPTSGIDLGQATLHHNNNNNNNTAVSCQLTLKSGPYGKFLHVKPLAVLASSSSSSDGDQAIAASAATGTNNNAKGSRELKALMKPSNKQLPAWVPDECSLADAVDFASLPKEIGLFPDTNTSIVLTMRQSRMYLEADGFPFQAELPPHVYVRDVTLDSAIEALRSSDMPNATAKRSLGLWRNGELLLRTGKFGPYVQWGASGVFAGLSKTMTLDTITYDDAVKLVEGRVARMVAKGGKIDPIVKKLALELKLEKKTAAISSSKSISTESSTADVVDTAATAEETKKKKTTTTTKGKSKSTAASVKKTKKAAK